MLQNIYTIAVALALVTYWLIFEDDGLHGLRVQKSPPVVVRFDRVKPIFENRCKRCHSALRWDWTEYETALKNKDKIKFRVWTTKTMPPDRQIEESERELIRDWVDGGGQK